MCKTFAIALAALSIFAVQICTFKLFLYEDCFMGVQLPGVKCWNLIPVFRYSLEEGDCVLARYGGCNASRNNFNTYEECVDAMFPVCKDET